MSNALNPNELLTDERLAEVNEILARGILPLKARRTSLQKIRDGREIAAQQ